ncbi:MAG: site-specific DNA-methyltransferase [Lentisphaeria bacterium]|nr:site-specific DNA-methyltransferase [Lentisphaeria bacterium]
MPILNWMGREKAVKHDKEVALKILHEDKSLSYGTGDNILVHGDNLEALKSLLPFYAGEVKCIYIDPPYNTGSAFEHYDDNLEHSIWLNMMYPRLKLLREFLREDGSIWISIDEAESHYLKVMCDEIFGRKNFIANIVWQQRTTRENRKVFSANCETLLVYAQSAPRFGETRNELALTDEILARYKNPDNDPRGLWQSVAVTAQAGHATPAQFYDIRTPSGRIVPPPAGNCWRYTQARFEELVKDNRIWFGKAGNNVPRYKKFLSESNDQGVTPETLWLADFAGTNDEAKKETNTLFEDDTFETPKPERLIQRILEIATNAGDLVLDSFLGSGTTAAVAHKMGRRWIGIEMGDHAKTHCAVRLKKVVDGEQGGVSTAVNWQGGGGFRFYELGETILNEKGQLSASIPYDVLAAHIWWQETGRGWKGVNRKSTVLGVHEGVAYALLYNGILHDRTVNGGNVLTRQTLGIIKEDSGELDYEKLIVYGEACRLGDARLEEEKIDFRQTPYDVVTRR